MKTIPRLVMLLMFLISIAVLSSCGGSQDNPMSITTPSLPNGTVGTAYSQIIQAKGGSGRFSWSLASGTLPHNLSLSSSTTNSITLSGTPDTEAQSVQFAISVKDSSNHSAQKKLHNFHLAPARQSRLVFCQFRFRAATNRKRKRVSDRNAYQ